MNPEIASDKASNKCSMTECFLKEKNNLWRTKVFQSFLICYQDWRNLNILDSMHALDCERNFFAIEIFQRVTNYKNYASKEKIE